MLADLLMIWILVLAFIFLFIMLFNRPNATVPPKETEELPDSFLYLLQNEFSKQGENLIYDRSIQQIYGLSEDDLREAVQLIKEKNIPKPKPKESTQIPINNESELLSALKDCACKDAHNTLVKFHQKYELNQFQIDKTDLFRKAADVAKEFREKYILPEEILIEKRKEEQNSRNSTAYTRRDQNSLSQNSADEEKRISFWDNEEDMLSLPFDTILGQIVQHFKTTHGRREMQWEYCFRWCVYIQKQVFNSYSSELITLTTLGTWLSWYKEESLFEDIYNIYRSHAGQTLTNELSLIILTEVYQLFHNQKVYTYTQYLITEFGKVELAKGGNFFGTQDLERIFRILIKEIDLRKPYNIELLPRTIIDIYLDMPIP